jgi:hypothetical protein
MTDYFKINIGATVEEQFKNDLQVEYDAVKRLNDGIKLCVAQGDNASRELAEKILTDEEHHIDWLEAQLHAIGEMGIANYLAQQLKKEDYSRRSDVGRKAWFNVPGGGECNARHLRRCRLAKAVLQCAGLPSHAGQVSSTPLEILC